MSSDTIGFSVLLKGLLVAAVVALPGVASAHPDHGQFIYVPNRASADVAVIDSASDRVVARRGQREQGTRRQSHDGRYES